MENPENECKAPEIFEYEVYDKILAATEPKAGVPEDLTRKLITEFGPELTAPICKISTTL